MSFDDPALEPKAFSNQTFIPISADDDAVMCDRIDADSFPCNHQTASTAAITAVSVGIATGGLALLFCLYLSQRLKRHPMGTDEMNRIAAKIQSGSRAFLQTEYSYLTVFAVIVYVILLVLYTLDHPTTNNDAKDGARYSSAFLLGAGLSAYAGWWGMNTATHANVRTTQAADQFGLSAALRVAFTGGAVTGFVVVGLGLTGLSVMYWLLTLGYSEADGDRKLEEAANALAGFGFGASSIALFARVAGGIYTKAADVGADLVGKMEMDIDEDDPRNPAVIADNVGDNVGDVAGMGADLFESFVGSIIAAVSLSDESIQTIMLPFWIAGGGIVASIIGFFCVGIKDDRSPASSISQKALLRALHKGIWVSSIVAAIFFGIICVVIFDGHETRGKRIYGCIVIGLIAGVAIGYVTEYFTSYSYGPVQSIVRAGITGPATVIIQGLGIGMLSTACPTVLLVATILGCNALAGGYGIAMAAVGMLSTLGVTLATDAYGPIADNAGGIAEMARLEHRVRQTTDALDAMGNTTAATGKGFAIGSAVLTALSLLAAFTEKSGLTQNGVAADISEPVVLAGVLVGAVLPFLFAALTMLSVQKAAGAMIMEVRRQFAEIPGLKEGTAEADSDKCVAISTRSSVQEMVLPGLFAILSPITVGFLVGPRCLTGMLGGAIASGMMLAIMMANAGGAWDNSKKYIEIEGACGGKGTNVHKACIVGDTVGDPFKDTSGPALNILIKLMSIISLTIAPLLRHYDKDFEFWYFGLIPLGALVIGTLICYRLFWTTVPDLSMDLSKKGDVTADFVKRDREEELEVVNEEGEYV